MSLLSFYRGQLLVAAVAAAVAIFLTIIYTIQCRRNDKQIEIAAAAIITESSSGSTKTNLLLQCLRELREYRRYYAAAISSSDMVRATLAAAYNARVAYWQRILFGTQHHHKLPPLQ